VLVHRWEPISGGLDTRDRRSYFDQSTADGYVTITAQNSREATVRGFR
jgi:hypothetical protein